MPPCRLYSVDGCVSHISWVHHVCLAQAVLSLERLRRFLETPEVEPLPVLTPSRPLGPAVSFKGVDLQWAADTQPFLQDVTLEANPRSLTVVIGTCSSRGHDIYLGCGLHCNRGDAMPQGQSTDRRASRHLLTAPRPELAPEWYVSLACCDPGATGSGKSGLLLSLLGDLSPSKGELRVEGSIAYVAQVEQESLSLLDRIGCVMTYTWSVAPCRRLGFRMPPCKRTSSLASLMMQVLQQTPP